MLAQCGSKSADLDLVLTCNKLKHCTLRRPLRGRRPPILEQRAERCPAAGVPAPSGGALHQAAGLNFELQLMPVWGSFRLRHQPVHTQCSRHAHGPVLACRHSRTPMLASSTHTLAARRPLSLHNQAPRHSRRQQRHRCHSRPCHASASPSDPVPDLSHIQPHQRPEPGGWDTIQHLSVWRRLLSKGRQALSLAVLAACAFLALLLPSTAWCVSLVRLGA